MIDQEHQQNRTQETQRRAGVTGFVVGMIATLGFFAFFPGLPHVIDAGAIVAALTIGALTSWACRTWSARRS